MHNHLLDHLSARVRTTNTWEWWHAAALRAWEKNHVQLIQSRDGSALYLARFWLTPPIAGKPNGDGAVLESGDSVLLHFFAQGDDDAALHDHPWNFTTTLLSGGYTERRPPLWHTQIWEHRSDRNGSLGCPWDDCVRTKRIPAPHGLTIRRKATDQHAVEDVLPDTWTIMTTERRQREWGFHPPGRVWTPWESFLAEKRGGTAPAAPSTVSTASPERLPC